ncbi:hypothetical protein TTHERM_00566670 (macronuclear) [Tetrahymena thermophila SB210]|uniref:Uncharacterized protein n=1 Tax=Tetrahymena thermophila (strain SB210) TaxID=312017 RepID=I7LWH7_TETTS|nr:hypothetical protein TTHERM_00566670 [Tetrahymena thermophila SB210]EAS01823.2 hypothetical protein TTHERM_00566670 [Tetrahymena thermophila SB210]|eukprot:XP_001022068.2 hypothetical protein TTHERM_00566670 [Tetrahymena thermophila SB210]
MPSLTQQLVNVNQITKQVQIANQNIMESDYQNKDIVFSRTNSLYENNQTPNIQEKKQDQEPQNIITLQIVDNKQQTTISQNQYVPPQIKVHKVEDIQNEQPKTDNKFLYVQKTIKKILKNSLINQETIKDADILDSQIVKKESFDQSDFDILYDINKQLEGQQEQNDIDLVERKEEFKEIMQTSAKKIELSKETRNFISSQIDRYNQFKEAKNPQTVLLYQDIIQQVKDKYNEEITEYSITSLYLKEANIKICNQDNKTIKTVIPVYRQRVFSITSHNSEKYKELQKIFETQIQTKRKNKFQEDNLDKQQNQLMQQNTRIFFDLDSYQNNTKLNLNNHLIHRETFQYKPYDS